MLVKLLLITILIILVIFLILCDMSSFFNNKHDNMIDVHNLLHENNTDPNELILEKQEENVENVMSKVWSPNNTLESMIKIPLLENEENVNRLTCFAAPAWWYPINKYNSDNFKSKHYRESINPIYDYLGNSQDMYWDFKSVNQ